MPPGPHGGRPDRAPEGRCPARPGHGGPSPLKNMQIGPRRWSILGGGPHRMAPPTARPAPAAAAGHHHRAHSRAGPRRPPSSSADSPAGLPPGGSSGPESGGPADRTGHHRVLTGALTRWAATHRRARGDAGGARCRKPGCAPHGRHGALQGDQRPFQARHRGPRSGHGQPSKRSAHRSQDLLGCWGGDEFVLLLPDTGPASALHVARRLQNRLRGADSSQAPTPSRPAPGSRPACPGRTTTWCRS